MRTFRFQRHVTTLAAKSGVYRDADGNERPAGTASNNRLALKVAS